MAKMNSVAFIEKSKKNWQKNDSKSPFMLLILTRLAKAVNADSEISDTQQDYFCEIIVSMLIDKKLTNKEDVLPIAMWLNTCH